MLFKHDRGDVVRVVEKPLLDILPDVEWEFIERIEIELVTG